MRPTPRSVLAALSLLTGSGPFLAAQERPDSTATADSTADSLESPASRRRGPNPYLREVGRPESRSLRRGRYFASFGLGVGSEAISVGAPGVHSPWRIRPSATFAAGVSVGQALRVGFDGFSWFNATDDGVEAVLTAMFGTRLYPLPANGLYLHAGVGVGRYGLLHDLVNEYYCECASTSTEVGWAYSLGAGYDVPVGRGLWMGPVVEMIRFNVPGPDGYRERVVYFGISLTYDRRKADLRPRKH
jgi:hypothetical protein